MHPSPSPSKGRRPRGTGAACSCPHGQQGQDPDVLSQGPVLVLKCHSPRGGLGSSGHASRRRRGQPCCCGHVSLPSGWQASTGEPQPPARPPWAAVLIAASPAGNGSRWGMAPCGDGDMATGCSFPRAGAVPRPPCSLGRRYRAPGTERRGVRSRAGPGIAGAGAATGRNTWHAHTAHG